jgi:hypothetical protein
MVRDHSWIIAAALFAFGVIAWVVVAERPPKSPARSEASRTLAADPDLRLVSERSGIHAHGTVTNRRAVSGTTGIFHTRGAM